LLGRCFRSDYFFSSLQRRNKTASPSGISNKSIAVLPFDNLSRDPDNAYFTEGVEDEILTQLAKVADLKVISRTSTQHSKARRKIYQQSRSNLESRTFSKEAFRRRPIRSA